MEDYMTISLRLDKELMRKLASLAKATGLTKSELVRKILRDYLAGFEQGPTAWELGKDLFGCYKSGQGNLSLRAKDSARAQIRRAKTT